MKRCDFIPDDGYTFDGYIAPVDGLHGELRFSYRPFVAAEKSTLQHKVKMAADPTLYYADAVAARLTAWSLVGPKGEGVLITPAAMRRVNPPLLDKLLNIVLGIDPSDIDPAWSEAAKNETAAAGAIAAETGVTAGTIMEQQAEKNSGAG